MEGRALRPMGVGEILDASINLFFRNFLLLAKVAATVAIPVFVVVFALDQIAFAEPPASTSFNDLGTAFVGEYEQVIVYDRFVAISLIEVLVSVVGYLLIIGATFRAVSELYVGRETSARESVSFAATRAHSLLWIGLLFVIGVVLASLALLLPGIWLLVAWSLATPILLAENVKGSKALGRSFNLVRNNWWRTFGVLVVGFIFIALFEFLLGLAGAGLTSVTEDSKIGSLLIVDGFQAITLIITAPLQAAIISVVYYDLRVRKEGFDVELLTQSLESPGAAPAGAAPSARPQTGPGGGTSEAPHTSQ